MTSVFAQTYQTYNLIVMLFSVYLDREKRSSSRSGRREVEKPSKRTNSGSERYWNNGGREDEPHDRTRPKLSAAPHEGKGIFQKPILLSFLDKELSSWCLCM